MRTLSSPTALPARFAAKTHWGCSAPVDINVSMAFRLQIMLIIILAIHLMDMTSDEAKGGPKVV